ncbi:MAG: UDP-N-acetylglucosamine 4,6-dehydratase (inverting) [Candidatus Thermoplasmatota archaeon]|nr:UDP-N-acetylglucosamine 4,6-dehydratase (inverting) [Candidatus Thermoplasmatota archaeon]
MDFLKNKVVLVTGGTGSFGQKFVQTILDKTEMRKVIVFSRDEFKQSQMKNTINDIHGRVRFFLGDVRDAERLGRAFKGVDYVIHAAALKQVPALEYNPFEAIKTNIIGTQNVANAALDSGVQKVLLVSTDKAANPANLYGATKLCAERLIIHSNEYSSGGVTKLSAIRYGNVFGSRGSLVKIITQQRENGEITLTHEEMTRFWITLDQGVEFVLLALEKMHGREIFVPKIPSMKIKDLLAALAPDCRMKIIGIRPGEKIHEVLVTPEEARHTKEFSNHYIILPDHEWFLCHENYAEGKKLSNGFYLSSNNNNLCLGQSEIICLLSSISKDY